MTIMAPIDHTLSSLDKAMEDKTIDEKPRPYLGMSAIGHDCWRKLWYDFHLCSLNNFKADTLRNFADGHYSEDLTAARLRDVPDLSLHTHNTDGRQFGFSDLGGHFRGHMDGAIVGIAQAPKTWHVWEHKCTNENKFRKLDRLKLKHGDKNALAEWDFVYFVQAVLYMHYAEMARHYLTVASCGSRKYTSCRTDANPTVAKELIDKAEMIITYQIPLDKISTKPDYYQCGWCPHNDLCHGHGAPIPTCRTCIYAAPQMNGEDGAWQCSAHQKNIPFDEQLKGCEHHTFVPVLLESFATQEDATHDGVKYILKANGMEFWNGIKGDNAYSSREIHNCQIKTILGEKNVELLRQDFGAKIDG